MCDHIELSHKHEAAIQGMYRHVRCGWSTTKRAMRVAMDFHELPTFDQAMKLPEIAKKHQVS